MENQTEKIVLAEVVVAINMCSPGNAVSVVLRSVDQGQGFLENETEAETPRKDFWSFRVINFLPGGEANTPEGKKN